MVGNAQAWAQGEALLPGITKALHPAYDRARVSGSHTSGVGHHVVMKPRDDLFKETSDKLVCDDGKVLEGIQIFNENSVTSIPDNVGCVEVVSVGAQVQNVRPGEVCFIDFSDIAQGFQLANADHFVAPDHVFRCRFHPDTGTVEPLAGYAITQRAPDRMKVALTGTDRLEVPPHLLTEGIPSGFDSDGETMLRTIYEEVVTVGPPEIESLRRPMHRVERELLESIHSDDVLDMAKLETYLRWRAAPREVDLEPGDLVPFCTVFATKLRVRGQFLSLVPQRELLCVIDDRAILDTAIRAGKAGKLVLAHGSAA